MELYTINYNRKFIRDDGVEITESLIALVPAESYGTAIQFADEGLPITLGYEVRYVKNLCRMDALSSGAIIGVSNYQHETKNKEKVQIEVL